MSIESGKCVSWVRGWDQLGVPVSLNLNKQSTHQTFLGGCCSLLAIGLILFLLYSEIMQVVRMNYDESITFDYMKVGDNHEPYEFDTEDFMPAI